MHAEPSQSSTLVVSRDESLQGTPKGSLKGKDYYGFPPELYQLKFKSKGSSKLAQRVVDLYEQVNHADPLYKTSQKL